jgi:hypothetical protein
LRGDAADLERGDSRSRAGAGQKNRRCQNGNYSEQARDQRAERQQASPTYRWAIV